MITTWFPVKTRPGWIFRGYLTDEYGYVLELRNGRGFEIRLQWTTLEDQQGQCEKAIDSTLEDHR